MTADAEGERRTHDFRERARRSPDRYQRCPGPNPLDSFSPLQLDDELWHDERRDARYTDDPAGLELRAEDTDPDDEHDDPLEVRLLHTDTRWILDRAPAASW